MAILKFPTAEDTRNKRKWQLEKFADVQHRRPSLFNCAKMLNTKYKINKQWQESVGKHPESDTKALNYGNRSIDSYFSWLLILKSKISKTFARMWNVLPIDTCPGALPVGFPQLIGERGHGVRVSPAWRDRSCGGSRRLGRRQRPEENRQNWVLFIVKQKCCWNIPAGCRLGGGNQEVEHQLLESLDSCFSYYLSTERGWS